MTNAAELAIVIKARNEAQAGLNSFKSGIEGVGSKLRSVTTLAIGAVGAFATFSTLKGAVEKTQELSGEVSKLRRELGVTPEEASKLNFAIKRVGLTVEEVAPAFGIFQRNLVHAKDALQDGEDVSKNFGAALDKLGLSQLKTTGSSTNMIAVIDQVADRFKLMRDGAEKNTIAMDLFGRSGRALIPLLNLGSEGLRQMAADAQKLGVVLTTKNIAQVKALTVAQRDLSQASAGLKLQIGFALIPILTAFTGALVFLQPILRAIIEQGIKTLSNALRDGLIFILPHAVDLIDKLGAKLDALRPILAVAGSGVLGITAGLVLFGPAIATTLPLLGLMLSGVGALISPFGALLLAAGLLAFMFRDDLPGAIAKVKDGFKDALPVLQQTASDIGMLGQKALEFGQWLLSHQRQLVEAIVAIGFAFAWTNPFGAIVVGIGAIIFSLELMRTKTSDLTAPLNEVKLRYQELFLAIISGAADTLDALNTVGSLGLSKLGLGGPLDSQIGHLKDKQEELQQAVDDSTARNVLFKLGLDDIARSAPDASAALAFLTVLSKDHETQAMRTAQRQREVAAAIQNTKDQAFHANLDPLFAAMEHVRTGAFLANSDLVILNDTLAAIMKKGDALAAQKFIFQMGIQAPGALQGNQPPANFAPLFHHGGMVPGPFGAPQLILAHGGERVLTPAQQRVAGGTPAVSITNHYEINADMTEGTIEKLIRRMTDAQDAALRRTYLQGSQLNRGVFSP